MAKYSRNQLVKKTLGELRKIWTEDEARDITDFDDDHKKSDIIDALLEIEDEELEDELEDELDDEEEAEVEAEVEVEEEEVTVDDEEEDDLELPDEEEPDVEEDDIEEEAPKPAAKKSRKAKKSDDDEGSGTLAAKQVATILGTEAKTLRQFFRSPASTVEAVGSGGRYEFREEDIDKIKSEFDAWKAGHGARGNKRTGEGGSSKKSRKTEAPVIEEVEELEIEDLEDEELELEDED